MRNLLIAGAALLVVLVCHRFLRGFAKQLSLLIELVPKPVLGGAGLVLFGTVAAGGIRTLAKADLGDPVNSLIVGVSLFIGMTPTVVPSFYEGLPAPLATIMGSGISAGCLTAIVLHQAFRIRAQRVAGAAGI